MWTDNLIVLPVALALLGTLVALLCSIWDARHGVSGTTDADNDPRRFFAPARADDEDARRRLELCRFAEAGSYALSDVSLRHRQSDF